MDKELSQQLQQWYQQWRSEDALQSDRLLRWRNIEPESAELLALWVRSKQAKRVLELGTSNGYSTIWLADAVRATQGHVISVELDAERSHLAAQHLQQVGLDAYVSLVVQDIGNFLPTIAADFDVILLDAERPLYVSYWPQLQRLLQHPGALLVVDNVLSHVAQVKEFNHLVHTNPEYCVHTINSGAGLLCITRNQYDSNIATDIEEKASSKPYRTLIEGHSTVIKRF